MSNWIGYAVSVNCGEPLGCYQGTILEADGNTLTLTKAFRNGFPYPKLQVTLNAADIKDLKIIEAKPEPSEQTHSTVAVTKSGKKAQKATVCENLQANPAQTSSGTPSSSVVNNKSANRNTVQGPTRSKPIEIQANRNNKNNNHAGSYGNCSSTPKGRNLVGQEKARRRNEACFGESTDAIDDDFDFEGNLALFDKRAFWEQMRNSHKPDLVRQADDAGKYKHDENVLGTAPVARHAMRVPDNLRGPIDYVTDEGVIVPSVVPRVRRQLWEGMVSYGLAECAYTLLARCAADVALRLVGGGRRLEPRNAHQPPCVLAVPGPHRAGAAALRAARLLAAHGARPAYVLPAAAAPALQPDVDALALCGVAPADALDAAPSPDLVLLALYDPLLDDPQDKYESVLQWVGNCRAPIISIEPPARGWRNVSGRAAVLSLAPPAVSPSLGRLYLAHVGAPTKVYTDLRLAYRPPFGASTSLALHPSDD